MQKITPWMALFLALLPLLSPAASPLVPTNAKWEAVVQGFEAHDKQTPPPANGILFLGSSSIARWKTLSEDFSGLPVYNRGISGSELIDAVIFADRIVIPHKPRLIVFYAGSNDLSRGKFPQIVLEDFVLFAEKIHTTLPDTRIAFVSIAPNPARWKIIDQFRAANILIRDYIGKNSHLVYVDVMGPMLGADGHPLPDIYVEDNLHMNPKGYAVWTKVITPYLR